LENLLTLDTPFHQEESGFSHPEKIPHKAVQWGGATFIATEPSIPTLRRGRDTEEAPVKSVSTWIRNQRKEPKTLSELRRNPFLSPSRKKFGICIYIDR
jgi:hypothetical protein